MHFGLWVEGLKGRCFQGGLMLGLEMENRKDDKVKGPRSMPEAVQASVTGVGVG